MRLVIWFKRSNDLTPMCAAIHRVLMEEMKDFSQKPEVLLLQTTDWRNLHSCVAVEGTVLWLKILVFFWVRYTHWVCIGRVNPTPVRISMARNGHPFHTRWPFPGFDPRCWTIKPSTPLDQVRPWCGDWRSQKPSFFWLVKLNNSSSCLWARNGSPRLRTRESPYTATHARSIHKLHMQSFFHENTPNISCM